TTAFEAFRLTKVDAASQFTYAQKVEAVRGNIGTQRAEGFQPLVQLRGTQVAEQLKVFTQRQQRTALWLLGWRQVFTFWAADGAEQYSIGLFTACDRLLRHRLAVAVNGDTTHIVVAGGNTHVKPVTDRVQYFQCLRQHVRAHTVVRQNCNMIFFRHHTV